MGEQRADYRMAIICSTIMNIAISLYGKKGTRPVTPKDFLPNWDGTQEERPRQSIEDMKQALLSWAHAHNRQFRKRRIDNRKPPSRPAYKVRRKTRSSHAKSG